MGKNIILSHPSPQKREKEKSGGKKKRGKGWETQARSAPLLLGEEGTVAATVEKEEKAPVNAPMQSSFYWRRGVSASYRYR